VRRLLKGRPPAFFAAWLTGTSPDWRPSWAALDSDAGAKQPLKEDLCVRQRFLCCYCESRISPTPDRAHIEHLDSRFEHSDRAVVYENLLGSCSRPGSCGDAKGSQDLPVTPLDEDCDRAFRYRGDGTVEAFAGFGRHADAVEALRVLRLDHPLLIQRRREALRTLDGFDEAERARLIADLERGLERLPEYVSALRQYLRL
jgi:uncharacterized protein (TIGR02646 family)